MPAAKFGGLVLVLGMVLMVVVAAAGGAGASADDDDVTTGPSPLSAAGGGCSAINPCDANPCVHGTCSADDIRSVEDIGNKPTCHCSVGWGGARCDQALATYEDENVGGGWFLVRRTVGTGIQLMIIWLERKSTECTSEIHVRHLRFRWHLIASRCRAG